MENGWRESNLPTHRERTTSGRSPESRRSRDSTLERATSRQIYSFSLFGLFVCVFLLRVGDYIAQFNPDTESSTCATVSLSTVRECLHVCLRPLICHTEKKNKQTNGFLFFV